MAKVKEKRQRFEIGGICVEAGETAGFDLKVPDLYIHTDLSIPVQVIHGKRDGPVMFLSGAIHGDEIIGVEIIRRCLTSKVLSQLRGTLIAVPVVNVFGFLSQSRYLPDRRDLNRSFPGSEKGSIASRLAHVFINEIVSRCTHGIDLHTAAVHRENLPQVRAEIDNQNIEAMARAFGLPVIVNSSIIDGSLRAAASKLNVDVLVYEAGEALRFDETAIRGGVNGVLGVMREIGMLPKRKSTGKRGLKEPKITRNSKWIRAPQSGIHRSVFPLGALVKKGDCLGYIADPMGANEAPVIADVGGVIIGRSNMPLMTEGEALFHLATFEEVSDGAVAREIHRVEEVLEQVTEEMDIDEPPIF